MRVRFLSYTDGGGAGRAAHRLLSAVRAAGIDASMCVMHKTSADPAVVRCRDAIRLWAALSERVGARILRHTPAPGPRSLAIGWSGVGRFLQRPEVDLIHLHWLGSGTLGIGELGRIRKPLVWTMHDMWPFCGTEHLAADDDGARWRHGYPRRSSKQHRAWLDLDRLTFRRKQRCWRRPAHLVAPSRWLADCARASPLTASWPIAVIPNPLDTAAFRPLPTLVCRDLLRLPQDRSVILFGAPGAATDPNKGFDLLRDALGHLAASGRRDLVCAVFGEREPRPRPEMPLPTFWLGRLHDDLTLAMAYSAADVMAVPSRQENLPQTATEAQACGTPVVAFRTGGLADVVEHEVTGFLATPFDTADLARGIAWVLANATRRQTLGERARERAVRLWSPEVVAAQYLAVYELALDRAASIPGGDVSHVTKPA